MTEFEFSRRNIKAENQIFYTPCSATTFVPHYSMNEKKDSLNFRAKKRLLDFILSTRPQRSYPSEWTFPLNLFYSICYLLTLQTPILRISKKFGNSQFSRCLTVVATYLSIVCDSEISKTEFKMQWLNWFYILWAKYQSEPENQPGN